MGRHCQETFGDAVAGRNPCRLRAPWGGGGKRLPTEVGSFLGEGPYSVGTCAVQYQALDKTILSRAGSSIFLSLFSIASQYMAKYLN